MTALENPITSTPPTDVILNKVKDLRFARSTTQPRKSITFGIQTISRTHSSLHTMRERCYYAYITASRTHVLYIGVTGGIERRIAQHKSHTPKGFTARYRCDRLVWFERYRTPGAAIAREKELKGWRRTRKIELIERENPTWIDLSEDWGKTFP
ncbi:MAG: GIY-YIG nuclease family protein [Silvibacterium sp.]